MRIMPNTAMCANGQVDDLHVSKRLQKLVSSLALPIKPKAQTRAPRDSDLDVCPRFSISAGEHRNESGALGAPSLSDEPKHAVHS